MTATTTFAKAQTTFFISSEIEQLRAELQRERAQRDELAKIITMTEWPPAERVTMATLLLQSWANPANSTGQWAVIGDGGAGSVANITGLSESTANNVVKRLKEAGLVDRRVERGAVNRYGEPIRTRDMLPERGDRWENTSTIAIVSKLPDTLPALIETTYTAKQRARASDIRKLADLAKKAMELPCPHCGTVGELHLACRSCGVVMEANELAKMADEAQHLEQGGAIVAQTTVMPMTDEQQHKATGRRRMRDVRGVPSTPGMGVTYEHFEDDGIDINLNPTQLLKIEVQSSASTDGGRGMGTGTGTGDAETQNLRFSYSETQNLRFSGAGTGLEGTEGGNDGPPTDWDVIMGGGANE